MKIELASKTTPIGDYKLLQDGPISIALVAIRNCYSPFDPSEILGKEGARYFRENEDGELDVVRLIKTIANSGHTSTLEHISFGFAIEGVSRNLMAQLTRHRMASFSIKSQRYVKQTPDSRAGEFEFILPPNATPEQIDVFMEVCENAQAGYNKLVELGMKAEDARGVIPGAAATAIFMTVNLASLLNIYKRRQKGNGAQSEIAEMTELLRGLVVGEEPWTNDLFEFAAAVKDAYHQK